ncbi:ATP-binding protein [Streptomyces triculaminicus]|uniref:ATP-binding protein n=1 Tax=Streptomyces triculaminicus TaxID=2816232 RepID=UPI00378925FA
MHDDDPQPIGGHQLLDRCRAILAARGLTDTPPGPTDTTLTPDDPGHPDYHRRQRSQVALARWERATPYRYQHATATHPDVITWARRAAADLRDVGFLVLNGNIGTGKTHEAYGALRRIAESGPARYELIATTAPDMYGRLRPGGSDKGTEYELRRLASVPLLLLDDLGTEKLSEWTEEATYRLLNERYNQCRPLIVTTNLPVRAPRDNHGQPTGPDLVTRLGERLASRLAEASTVITLTGPDRRRQLRNAS